ncbi:hypothetical protein ACF0H5_014567 [Mactra antiquata]
MATFMSMRFTSCKLCGHPVRRGIVNVSKLSKRYKATKLKQADTLVWEPVIGLEIHAQIAANAKLFSGASSQYGGAVNTQVSFLDSALPGTLPVLNKRCVEAGVTTAIALGCTINKVSRFDRKHYFYADLPAGYQITQQNHALANNGEFKYFVYGKYETDCVEKSARILQLQLEQDSGKSLHDDIAGRSLIDLNRAGCALMEIVTAPDFHTGSDAKSFVRDIKMLLVTLGTCDGKMSEGSMRVDANISVHKPGQPLGVRSEVKNLNSLTSVKKAIDYEIERQISVLENGGEVINETRSFDVDTGETLPMRDKELKQDYRFMPEPNLPPLRLYYTTDKSPSGTQQRVYVDILEKEIPMLPRDKRNYLIEKYGLNSYRANFIVNALAVELFDDLVKGKNIKSFSDFLMHQFLNLISQRDLTVAESNVMSSDIDKLYEWYQHRELSLENIQKIVTGLIEKQGASAREIAETLDLWQINDEKYLTDLCKQIIEENPKHVAKYKRGKKRALDRLIGQAKQKSNGKADLSTVNDILIKMMKTGAE